MDYGVLREPNLQSGTAVDDACISRFSGFPQQQQIRVLSRIRPFPPGRVNVFYGWPFELSVSPHRDRPNLVPPEIGSMGDSNGARVI